MIKIIVVCLIAIQLQVFISDYENGEELYPTITMRIKISDSESKEAINNASLISELYYDYTTPACQHELAPVNAIVLHEKIIKHLYEIQDSTRIREYKEKLINLQKKYENDLIREKIPSIDTFAVDGIITSTLRKPVRKYTITVSHPKYETVILSDERGCGGLELNVMMNKIK